jgi:uncharacterized protein YdeI (YjbR/CyaY-like superfamily)
VASPPRFFRSAAEFRGWLEAHHDRALELLVGLHKKAATGGLRYPEALDEALAFGWIDGVRRRIDEQRWCIRFTPRRPRSIWSHINIKRANELIALGRMRPPGLRAFDAREPARSGIYLYERTPTELDEPAAAELAAHPRARRFLDAQPPGYRRHVVGWVMAGQKEETRRRRLAKLIEVSVRGERIDFMKPLR